MPIPNAPAITIAPTCSLAAKYCEILDNPDERARIANVLARIAEHLTLQHGCTDTRHPVATAFHALDIVKGQ